MGRDDDDEDGVDDGDDDGVTMTTTIANMKATTVRTVPLTMADMS